MTDIHHHHEAQPYTRHVHTEQERKAVLNRLARVSGHLEAIKRMVKNGDDCSKILIQLAAVKAAINNTGKLILKNHINQCLLDAFVHGDHEMVDDLNAAIDKFVK